MNMSSFDVGTGSVQKPRKTQRAPKSCYQCSKKRVKCNKQIPCQNCIKRGQECFQEAVIVKGVILNDTKFDLTEKLKTENEFLHEKIQRLEAKLSRQDVKLMQSMGSVVNRDYVDKLGTGARLVSRDLLPGSDVIDTDTERLTSAKLEKLSRFVTRDVSRKLVEFNLENLYLVHSAVHPNSFLKEHELYWNDNSRPKHLNYEVNLSQNQYLWMAIWYAMISGALYTLDTDLELYLGLTSEGYFEMAKISSLVSLECLHRGQFLRIPNIRSIQAFCVLASCFHGFSGIHLQNSLLSCMIYIGQSLNLHRLSLLQAESLVDYEVSCRLWWILVVIDFLEDVHRQTILSDNFQTPIPRNISEDDLNSGDLNVTETDEFTCITYNQMIMKLSRIKKSLYYEDNAETSKFTFNQLNLADLELLKLQSTISNQILKLKDPKRSTRFAIFLTEVKLAHERLLVNRMVISHVSKEKWLSEYRYKCVSFAITVISKFNDKSLPFYFKKYWMTSEHSINAIVFLILDLVLHQLPRGERSYRLKLINECINILVLLKRTHTTVSRGLRIVEALLIMLQQSGRSKFTNMSETAEISNTISALKSTPRIYGSVEVKGPLKPENEQLIFKNYDESSETILNDLLQDNNWQQFLEWINSNSMKQ